MKQNEFLESEAKKFFDSLTREEFKKLLEDDGFEVVDLLEEDRKKNENTIT